MDKSLIKKFSLGGLGITALSGGALAPVGGVMMGLGAGAALSPVYKYSKGEHLTSHETGREILIGGAVGAATAPIGYASKALCAGASGVTKFAVRTGSGIAAGTTRAAIEDYADSEGRRNNEYGRSVMIGALAGGVGGSAGHFGSNAVNKLNLQNVGIVKKGAPIVFDKAANTGSKRAMKKYASRK